MATILVVDDEELICSLVQRVLERRGYTVVTCLTAREALELKSSYELLLVDFSLPEMDGRDLAAALREQRPNLPVILMSGYLSEDAPLPPPPAFFLQKPMLPSALTAAVETFLPLREMRPEAT